MKEIQETNDYDKNEEYNELRQSIIERIDEIDKFFELNFDKPYAFNFEKGRIRLKKLLMFEPNLINQLDNGKDFKGLAFGLRASNENVNTENINNIERERRPPTNKKNHLTRSVERSNNNMYMKTSSTNKGSSKVRSVDKKSARTNSNLRGSYNQPKSTMSKKNNLRTSGGVTNFKKSNTNYINKRQYNFMDEREEEDYNEEEDNNNYEYDDNEYNFNNTYKNINLRGSNYSKKSNGPNYNVNSSVYKSKPKMNVKRNYNNQRVNNDYYDNNNFEEEESFKGSNMSFKPNIELERYTNNNNMFNEEEEEDEDEKKNFAKEQLKEITLRFKLTEEEYRLLLREKAKIVVQIPSSTKHKTSNRVINKKAY